MKNNKFEIGDRVRVTKEAAEAICERESEVAFNFSQSGKIRDSYMMSRQRVYEVKFEDGSTYALPQSYLEKAEEEDEN